MEGIWREYVIEDLIDYLTNMFDMRREILPNHCYLLYYNSGKQFEGRGERGQQMLFIEHI